MPHFECGAFNHSATCPRSRLGRSGLVTTRRAVAETSLVMRASANVTNAADRARFRLTCGAACDYRASSGVGKPAPDLFWRVGSRLRARRAGKSKPNHATDCQKAVPRAPLSGGHDRAGLNMEDKMFAVIKTGGKQFRVTANDRNHHRQARWQSLATPSPSATVLMLTDGDKTTSTPGPLGDITVAGEIVEQARGEKVIAFKKRRRQNSKRKRGFRAELTVIRITDILTGGKKPEMKKGEALRGRGVRRVRDGEAEGRAEGAKAEPRPRRSTPRTSR